MRTAFPTLTLSDFVLTGTLDGETKELGRADSKSDWGEKTLELTAGLWTFTMTAQVDCANSSVISGVTQYRAELTQTISAGAPNTLTFDMKPVDTDGTVITKGVLSVSISLASNVKTPEKACAKLYEVTAAGETELTSLSRIYDISAGESVIYEPEVTLSGTDGSGTYRVSVAFYNTDGTDGSVEVMQNTWEAYARVVQGLTSSVNETGYNLNEVYKIEYNNADGAELSEIGEVQRMQYSRLSEAVALPEMKKEGWYFCGWYENSSYSGNPVTEIPANSTGKKVFYARWLTNTIYVKEGGNATDDGFTPETAVGSLADAESVILETAAIVRLLDNGILPYRIYVCGTVSGTQVLSENLTASVAESITLCGATGLDSSGLHQDVLDANASGTVLTISTTVPVTVKNLKITGGRASSTHGGGIYVAVENAFLTLAQGCLITENTAPSKNGGGVYITGGRLVLQDDAKVSENEAYSEAGGIAVYSTDSYAASLEMSGTSSIENCKTTRSGGWWGGGILASGKESKRCSIKLSESASIKGCSSKEGGGIGMIDFVDLELTDTVEISGNTASSDGAGIRVWNSTASISGGIIKSNTAPYGGAVSVKNNSTFYLSGGAQVDSGNDVALASGTTVTVSGELTGTAPVVTLNPAEWTRGRVIVTAASGVTFDETMLSYFALSDTDWNTKLSSDKKTILLDAPIYVAGAASHPVCGVAGDNTNGTGTKSKPFATLEKACSVLTDSTASYTIYVDGTLSGVQTLPDTVTADTAASLTVQGTDASAKIDAGQEGPSLTVSAKNIPITLLNLTITKGKTGYRGGGIHILNSGTNLTLGDGTAANAVLITGNTGLQGGGIYNAGSLTIKAGTTITSNTAEGQGDAPEGGGIYNAGTLTMEGGSITSNTAAQDDDGDGDGGGILNSGTFTFSGGTISRNTAKYRGGGIYNDAGTIYMCGSAVIGDKTDSTLGNRAEGTIGGAGIYSAGAASVYIGYKDSITADTEFTGGIYNNYSAADGGGIYITSAASAFKMAGGTIGYNSALNGGGIYNGGCAFTMSGGTIKGNEAAEFGGGVNHRGGNFCMSGSATIDGNKATLCGGGIFLFGGKLYIGFVTENTVNASYSGMISANHADGDGTTVGSGGGIAIKTGTTVYMEAGTIKGNYAAEGGAICNEDTFVINRSASIPAGANGETGAGKNDVYLNTERNATITVGGTLLAASPVATITPQSYLADTQVLKAGSGVTLADWVGKFALSDDGWGINSSGALVEYVTVSNVTASLSSLSANSKSSPHKITVYATSRDDFEAINTALKANSDKYVSITLVCPGLTELPELENDSSSGAFYDCTTIVEVTLPEGFTTIGSCAFNGCSNLSTLNLPSTLKSTTYRDLNRCTSLTSLTLPEGLESIGSQSLAHSGITSITIPENVKLVAYDAFCQTNPTLQSIIVVSENQYYKDIDGVLYNKSGTLLSCCPAAKTGELVIQDGVTEIGSYSCYCGKITSLTIPSSVTQIGSNAFQYSSQLATITFTGTKAQWNAITKGSNWKYSLAATKVTCSDGEVNL
ncbi:MAG: leucine-rich repeat protein [Treponema sp.]|nr:leucine-rich repeat protein [Treponema sp.]